MRVDSGFSPLTKPVEKTSGVSSTTEKNSWIESLESTLTTQEPDPLGPPEPPVAAPYDPGVPQQMSIFAQFMAQQAQNQEEEETKSAADEFLDFARKSPAEIYRELCLKRLGLTESDLAGMTAEKRKEIEKLIEDMILAEMRKDAEKATGIPVAIAVPDAEVSI